MSEFVNGMLRLAVRPGADAALLSSREGLCRLALTADDLRWLVMAAGPAAIDALARTDCPQDAPTSGAAA